MVGGGVPFYVKVWSIFARGASAVTPSEKNSINTNKKSTTSFPMSLRWTVYVAPKDDKGEGAQNR